MPDRTTTTTGEGNWGAATTLNLEENPDFIIAEPENLHLVNCDIHGPNQQNMSFTIFGEGTIGTYCMKCYNDFITRNIRNFSEPPGFRDTTEAEELTEEINY